LRAEMSSHIAVAATWNFGSIAVIPAIPLLVAGGTALDVLEAGIRAVELDNDDQYYVGLGGYPNANGIMEVDAAIMDHDCRYGAVMSLTNILHPISVARTVLEKSPHNVITGSGALQWALTNGFEETNILTPDVRREWEEWKMTQQVKEAEASHDTIGLICRDQYGNLAVGTSTSGWKFKWPGRVGDAPMIGSGLYCDGTVGAAVATGDGEEIMRVCLSFMVVEYMRHGYSVKDACAASIKRIMALKPASPIGMHSSLTVGVIAMDKVGNIGAASTLDENNRHRNNPFFPVSYWTSKQVTNEVQTLEASIKGAST
jgi:N4-(beta-N-acetylglucosaminyl)-L-asparaginase